MLIVVALPLLLNFVRNAPRGRLSADGYEQLQAARYLAVRHRARTLVSRPLETRYLKADVDGSLPDLRHPPLYTALLAGALTALREKKPSTGDRAAALLGAVLALAAAAATWWLAARLFPRINASRAAFLCAFGGSLVVSAVTPSSVPLAVGLMALLGVALLELDRGDGRPVRLLVVLAAGILWGLLFLSLYSSLIFLPVLVIYLWRVTRGSVAAVVVFLIGAGLVGSVLPIRALGATGNPLFHARLFELVSETDAYPGASIYRAASLPKGTLAYLADGGLKEVLRKAGRTLAQTPVSAGTALGPICVLLWVGAGLSRFTDGRANRLRGLSYALFGAHALGLSLFVTPERAAAALMVHIPLVAALGAGFLDTLVLARCSPGFYRRASLIGWTALAALPGLARIWGGSGAPYLPFALYDWLGRADTVWAARGARGDLLIAADDAPEVVYRLGTPSVFLPVDTVEFLRTEQQLNHPIDGVFLTSDLVRADDRATGQTYWREAHATISGYWTLILAQPASRRSEFAQRYPVNYPTPLSLAMQDFSPIPLRESEGTFSIICWHRRIMPAR